MVLTWVCFTFLLAMYLEVMILLYVLAVVMNLDEGGISLENSVSLNSNTESFVRLELGTASEFRHVHCKLRTYIAHLS